MPVTRALEVRALLLRYRFACTTEDELQRGIETVLREEGIAFQREKHASRKDRPDFLLGDGVAIEAKIDGSLTSVMRQLARYAELPNVTAILFVTTRATQALRIPKEFSGKPVCVALVSGVLG